MLVLRSSRVTSGSMRVALCVIASVLVLASCGSPSPVDTATDPGSSALSGPPSDSPGSATAPATGPLEIAANGTCPVSGDLEGRFTSSSQMPDYLSCVVPGADQWIDTVYGQMPHPAAYIYVPRGVSGTDTAGCPYDDQALQYCLGSQIVYLGEASVWQQYTTYGDAAAVVVLAHEITHHFQRVLGMPTAQTPNEQIRYENQSDCGAGAFMAYASAAGMVQPDDDIVDLAGSLAAAAEVEGGDRTHGTISQRLESFDRSFLAGQNPPMAMCIAFVPEVPIVG